MILFSRIFEEAVRNREGIKKISIHTNFANSSVDDNRLRKMILCLPAADECHITPSKILWVRALLLTTRIKKFRFDEYGILPTPIASQC